ncbi:hypothetical protein [Kaarinaea lacus]
MLDYLYYSAMRYQELHGKAPNLLYLNHAHLKSLQMQLESQNPLTRFFREWDLKIALSPNLSHPSFACV